MTRDEMLAHTHEVCKIGQAEACCRYLVVGTKGFECCKIIPGFKEFFDDRVQFMTSKGDNCPGRGLTYDV